MKFRLMVYLLLAAVAIWAAAIGLPDKYLHVIFCDVGQGDATLITWGRVQVLVDGGPSDEVVKCLEKHMSIFDKRIEVVVLTHPQSDHLTGLISVFKRYSVMYFVGAKEGGAGDKYDEMNKLIDEKGIARLPLVAGDIVDWFSNNKRLRFEVVWPTKLFVEDVNDQVDINLLSRVGRVRYGDFEVLVTGDADSPVQKSQLETGDFGNVEVLKVPHHGSKTGMIDEWLGNLQPDLAVISVGENSYGHPTEETIAQLIQVGAEIRRTDIDGEIEVVSDGISWWLK